MKIRPAAQKTIPVFGGMVGEATTLFVVPVLYCAITERKLKQKWQLTYFLFFLIRFR